MIVDSVKGFEKYTRLHERFGKVYEYIRKTDLTTLSVGEYEIDGKDVYCKVEQGQAKGFEGVQLEIHDVYIDIHILLEGNETIGFRDRGRTVGDNQDYNEIHDIAFIEEEAEVYVNLGVGNMVICFPSDAHAPMLGDGEIKKLLIKVKA